MQHAYHTTQRMSSPVQASFGSLVASSSSTLLQYTTRNKRHNGTLLKVQNNKSKTKGGVRTPSTKVTDASKKAVKECQHAAGIKSGVACRHGLGYARGFTRLSTEAVTKRGKEGSSEQCLNAIFPAKASRSSRTRPI